ncbi:hypothetical protein A9F13_04g01694 [Clavispora lusitaniae]|uniref:Uncharacterized protein n=1 Tax=Clavispora lusitaniae TaxID=36911 RepID=A0AA91Q1I8_CLALS|nr:hypothetical protein A9F13_04g01694 [Clavispora lusitaniae]
MYLCLIRDSAPYRYSADFSPRFGPFPVASFAVLVSLVNDRIKQEDLDSLEKKQIVPPLRTF